MAANYTALGILGLSAASLVLYEVLRPKGVSSNGGIDVTDAGSRGPGITPLIDPTDAARAEDAARTQRGELRPLPFDVPVAVVEGALDLDPARGPVVAIATLALRAAPQATPVPFDVWIDFGDSMGPVQSVVVQPGTTQRLDLTASRDPFRGSLYTRVYVRARESEGSVDRGAIPPYLMVSQGNAVAEYQDLPPAPPAAPIVVTNPGIFSQ